MDSKPAFPHAETATAQDAEILVNKTAHFVEEWIDEHKVEVPAAVPTEIAAKRMADQCISDAESEGILADEINDEVGDLKDYIAETVLGEDGSDNDSPEEPAVATSSESDRGDANAEIPL
ncbi:DUF768 domain-containing protein [Mesorhizobium sp. CA13]|uniref:DUF768 domain-containing protein n=1 Tax=unclassified Mesorhizobium TaxID=325217 RepID=UPI0015E3BB80|nr:MULTISPECIES: DUF768 domain-containing protein [unclassified Mesorhizobium]MBZ9857524.1 DUF768 domain-containing protein [Mesorhizobium sp. CA13]MBZ9966729.1 DUF768 domain-containing protein [Mesorhizobium sp. BR1-1-2]MCA0014893.1 DUF768 domain-containing protein [Mesorhizobium sp. B294B1A1]MCA0040987.1 DUF768 domain-containing protein [Mesorhizobium sp. B292B1B]